jgi:hypothetical protein
MSSYDELLSDTRAELDERQRENWYDDEFTWRGYVGLPLGVSRFPDSIAKPLNNAFNNYVVAPAAAFVRRVGGEQLDPVTHRRIKRKLWTEPSHKPSAVTTSDGFKNLDDMSKNKKKFKLQTAPAPAQAPRAPLGTRRKNASGKWMVMGKDGFWHNATVPAHSSDGYTYMTRYNYRTNKYDILEYGYEYGGSRRPVPQGKKKTNLTQAFKNLKIKNSMDTSGVQISGAKSTGMNWSQIKKPRYQGDDLTTVTCKMYLGNINYATDGTVNWLPAGTVNTGGQYYFNPTLNAYMAIPSGQPLLQTANRYRRYRIVKGEVEFMPLISGYSNPNIRVAALVTPDVDEFMAVSNLPSYFVTSPATPTAQSTPTRSVLIANPKACNTPAWASTGFKCPLPPSKDWLYTASPDSTTSTTNVVDFTNSWSAYRQSLAFVLGINISGDLPAATLPVLEATMTMTVEFCGQGPAVSAAVAYEAPLKSLSTKIDSILHHLDPSLLDKLETKEDDGKVFVRRREEKDRDDELPLSRPRLVRSGVGWRQEDDVKSNHGDDPIGSEPWKVVGSKVKSASNK